MKISRFKMVVFLLALFSGFTTIPGKTNAQMSKSELRDLLELTAAASSFDKICNLMLEGPTSNFYTNFSILQEQYKLKLTEEDQDMLLSEAEDRIRSIARTTSQDMRAFVDNFGCETPERELFVSHYRDLANAEPGEFLKRIMTQRRPAVGSNE